MFYDLYNCAKNAGRAAPSEFGHTSEFSRDEDGSVSIMVGFLLLIILAIGGIGVDIMRFERDRSKLQSVLDRAVLAAADLDQTQDPKDVVRDYLEKEGLLQYLENVKVTPESSGQENTGPLGFRIVEAQAASNFPTHFMHLSGVDSLTARASSVAEESIGEVEISLVLDVSGSMGDYNRLTNLKSAAQDFVDQMVENTRDGDMSISIVPYATQVAAPDDLMAELTTSGSNAHANCINFISTEFGSTEMNPATDRPATLHMNPWTWGSQSYDRRPYNNRVSYEICDDRSSREMMVFQKDANTLKTYIQNFSAGGNTSIDIGMKWGTALLDNSMNGVISNLSNTAAVPAEFSDRPAPDSNGDTLKVIVLMTDGYNTDQYEIMDPFREGASYMHWNAEEEVYSTYNADYDEYYWHGMNRWEDHAYGNGSYDEQVCTWWGYYGCYAYSTVTIDEPGSATQLSWPDLWEQTTVYYVRNLQKQWMGSTNSWNWYWSVIDKHGRTTKDTRARASCDAAKAKNIKVFSIAFEAPTAGQTLLQYCASSDSHYYQATGAQITDVFTSIGSSIRKLRLTQ